MKNQARFARDLTRSPRSTGRRLQVVFVQVHPLTDYTRPLSDNFHANGNEAEVVRWARHFGVFDNIKDPCRPGPRWSMASFADHPTHWIVFTRVWGHPKERENGWFMYLYPKSTYSSLADCEERSLHLIRS